MNVFIDFIHLPFLFLLSSCFNGTGLLFEETMSHAIRSAVNLKDDLNFDILSGNQFWSDSEALLSAVIQSKVILTPE